MVATLTLLFLLHLQLSRLLQNPEPLVTEEDCWNFFADNMAPMTATAEKSKILDVQESNSSRDIIFSFLKELAETIQLLKINEVTTCH